MANLLVSEIKFYCNTVMSKPLCIVWLLLLCTAEHNNCNRNPIDYKARKNLLPGPKGVLTLKFRDFIVPFKDHGS
jgi:hypothetical protein